jgi:glycerol uptake operon antiterminator
MDNISSQLKNTVSDAIEIMPAIVAPLMLERVRGISAEISVVGGGLVLTLKEAEELLLRGLDAVSISNPEMWIR